MHYKYSVSKKKNLANSDLNSSNRNNCSTIPETVIQIPFSSRSSRRTILPLNFENSQRFKRATASKALVSANTFRTIVYVLVASRQVWGNTYVLLWCYFYGEPCESSCEVKSGKFLNLWAEVEASACELKCLRVKCVWRVFFLRLHCGENCSTRQWIKPC